MSEFWQDTVNDAISLRHRLHQKPEIAFQETDTAATIRARLDALGIEWRSCAGTGTVARLAPHARGLSIALRADMDALPILELGSVPWRSERRGFMHACGHDGHTATLLAAAQWLKPREDALEGPVTLIFQPAEEGGHGARHMIEDGALEGVDMIFGWHNWPAIPEGQAACPAGAVMCANATFTITIAGKGGHASQPELCRDPVLAGSAIVLALQQIVSRHVAPQDPAVLSVTSFVAPSGPTTIPDQATLEGSIRAASPQSCSRISDGIVSIAEATAAAYGVQVIVDLQPRYGATINHAEPARIMREAISAELGAAFQADIPLPIMASEDFSYYLEAVPGAFALIGAGREHAPCHNAHYDFNDRLISSVGRLYARLAGAPVGHISRRNDAGI